jgi:alpha-methylacyl-CoA racemase
VYETRDGKYLAVGSLEAKFYRELLRLSGIGGEELPRQNDPAAWPAMKQRLAAIFRTKTRDEWCRIMEGSEVCFAPVLSMSEAPAHPHNRHRGTFVEVEGVPQPAPAPRFSRTPGAIQRPPSASGADTDTALRDWGFSEAEVQRLIAAGVAGKPRKE